MREAGDGADPDDLNLKKPAVHLQPKATQEEPEWLLPWFNCQMKGMAGAFLKINKQQQRTGWCSLDFTILTEH